MKKNLILTAAFGFGIQQCSDGAEIAIGKTENQRK